MCEQTRHTWLNTPIVQSLLKTFNGQRADNRLQADVCPVVVGFSAMLSQKAVSAYFTSKQILPFGYEELYW